MPENSITKKVLTKTGTVTSDKMNKTITVRLDRVTHHKLYSRILRRSATVKVHDEKNAAKAGDTVKIIQTRPISKDKRWRLLEVVNKQ